MNRPSRATGHQQQASDPQVSIWVSANAGSGKTQVLVDRVLRLMLAGTDPSRILCLTFTKAAAAEMSARLFDRLGGWIAKTDMELAAELHGIGVASVDGESLRTARQLFTKALETPGGLKIQTIHAFCERLLQLFPLEAGVAPGFMVMDDRAAQEKLLAARDLVFRKAQADPNGELALALGDIAARVQANAFDALLAEVLSKRAELQPVLSDEHGIDDAVARLRLAVGLEEGDDRHIIRSALLALSPECRRFAEALAQGGATDIERSQRISSVLDRMDGDLLALRRFYLTAEDEARSINSIATKKVRDKYPWVEDFVSGEQVRLCAALGKLACLECLAATRSLLVVSRDIIAEYEAAKRHGGTYDFNDLIARSRMLLQSKPDAAWVLYKLDGGLDHVLVDEAQDTSPAQWDIVRSFTSEFFAGLGTHTIPDRTLFVVGDRKQSIYSFQGADPDVFESVHDELKLHLESTGQKFEDVDFTVSFRSVAEVLEAVDLVFEDTRMARVGLDGARPKLLNHQSNRRGLHGVVELWPLAEPEESPAREPWTAPLDREPVNSPRRKLARQLAGTIGSWIGRREIAALGRAVQPSDILVLVRTRNSFCDALIRELRKHGIPVAGADRLHLLNSIAVLDFLALARVCLLPEDDHALACLLKSPLVPQALSEDQLFAVAWNRGRSALWERLGGSGDPVCRAAFERIGLWIEEARTARPYEFFAGVLLGCRGAILERLGSEASDALEALLDQALAYERERSSSIAGFVEWFISGEAEIKRNMEQASGEVRIMTVHGAKGLEAPIVILPDTADIPDRRQQSPLMMVSAGDGEKLPFWRLPKLPASERVTSWLADCDEKQAHEYRRLLYVAMTRARDELYVCGYCGARSLQAHCWYNLVADALKPKMVAIEGGAGWRLGPHPRAVALSVSPDQRALPLPEWAMTSIETERAKLGGIIPREIVDDRRVRKGLFLHKLLQHLPSMTPERQRVYAARAAKRAGFEDGALDELWRLFADPEIARYLGPDGSSEVPFMIRLAGQDQPVLGRIDRLVVTDKEILILDFKTDHPWPLKADEVRPDYLRQIAAYRHAIAQIYPGRPVRAALLWTAAPLFMEIGAGP